VIADARRRFGGCEVLHSTIEHGTDRVAAFVARLPRDFEDAVRKEQSDDVVDATAIDSADVGREDSSD
jgi:hypothetical protein